MSEFTGIPAVIFWIIACIVLVVAELHTYQLVAVWFAVGAVLAVIPAAFDMSVAWQLVVFVVVSAVCLAATRPFVKKVIKPKKIKTNADSVVGMTGVVLQEVDNLRAQGRVSVNGLDWWAQSATGENIPSNATVTVEKIDGVKLIVKTV